MQFELLQPRFGFGDAFFPHSQGHQPAVVGERPAPRTGGRILRDRSNPPFPPHPLRCDSRFATPPSQSTRYTTSFVPLGCVITRARSVSFVCVCVSKNNQETTKSASRVRYGRRRPTTCRQGERLWSCYLWLYSARFQLTYAMRVDTTVTLIAIAAGKSDPTHPLTSLRFRDSSPLWVTLAAPMLACFVCLVSDPPLPRG